MIWTSPVRHREALELELLAQHAGVLAQPRARAGARARAAPARPARRPARAGPGAVEKISERAVLIIRRTTSAQAQA